MEGFIGSRRTAVYFTILILMLFCSVIFVGWWYLFSPVIGNRNIAVAPAFLLMTVSAVSARQIGMFRAIAKLGGDYRWYNGFVPYLFLAVISAVGTLNAAFVLFESRAILRTDIGLIRGYYDTMSNKAKTVLSLPDYAGKIERLNGLLQNLKSEIVNPNGGRYCGVGDSAKKIISDITNIIPSYRVLNGSGPINPCDIKKAIGVYNEYEAMALKMIKMDAAFLKENGPEKLDFLEHLERHYATTKGALDELENAASGLGSAEDINKHALYEARSNYNSDRKTIFRLSGSELRDINEVGALQSEEVQSYASTMRLFARRISNWSTWVYVLAALTIDLATIFLMTQLNVRYGKPKMASPAVVEDERFKTDPQFLWVNP